MASRRVIMRKIREILRHKLVLGLSHRQTASAVGVSAGKVGQVSVRAKRLGLDWATVVGLDDGALEERLFGAPASRQQEGKDERELPEPAKIHAELSRAGVTLELLHTEYLAEHPGGYRYTAFCNHYRRWAQRQHPVMRQVHKAGDKVFIDYSGKRPHYVDALTGEVHYVQLFVGTLGASNLVYAEASRTQQVRDFIDSHVRMFDYFGGTARLWVPDQLKSAVTKSDRYEPEPHRSYADLARHYGAAILPARPRKPRDKAKVEVAVQIAQRWILAALRDEKFFSLHALNKRIWELLELLNDRSMHKRGGISRRALFESVERAALGPLPSARYEFCEWKKAKVNIDYHVAFDANYYSVPYALCRETVEICAQAQTVELVYKGKRVACHARRFGKAEHSTTPEHMPKAHRAHAQWSPTRILAWAASVGPHTRALCGAILNERPHPEMGYRSCLGILRLSKQYDHDRLEVAAERAHQLGARSYKSVQSMLKSGLDRIDADSDADESTESPIIHQGLRGSAYYH